MKTKILLVLVGIVVLGGCDLLQKGQVEELPKVGSSEEDGVGMVEEGTRVVGNGEDEEEFSLKSLGENGVNGTIEGPLSFPSEVIPEEMTVCAEPIGEGEEVCTDEHVSSDKFQNGLGFSVSVPEGEYYVYAYLPSNPDKRAYYNEYVTCGLKYECESHEKIEVSVATGEVTSGVMPHDWYEN